MRCPNCGNTLSFDDGAFCRVCMEEAKEKIRLKQKKIKEKEKK